MKPTSFEIPKGCTRVTIEQHEDKLVTIFELKEQKDRFESFIDDVINVNFNGIGVEFKEDEPEVIFNEGDILNCEGRIFIFSGKYGNCTQNGIVDKNLYLNNEIGFHEKSNAQYATKSEKQQLFDALAKIGKVWNPDKKCIEELKPKRWRAKQDGEYWLLDTKLDPFNTIDKRFSIDDGRYNCGNYFQTEQQSKDFAERIKQLPR